MVAAVHKGFLKDVKNTTQRDLFLWLSIFKSLVLRTIIAVGHILSKQQMRYVPQFSNPTTHYAT